MSIADEIVKKLPDLERRALILTKNRQWVDDLVQDTVTRAIDKQSQFKVGTNLDSWLFVIMRSIFNTFLYKKMGYKHDKPIINLESLPEKCIYDNELKEDYEIIGEHLNCLKQFNEDYYKMLISHVVDEKQVKLIAKENDVSVGTVMSRICRAKQFVNKLFCLKQKSDPTAWDINNNAYIEYKNVSFFGKCAEFVNNRTNKYSSHVVGPNTVLNDGTFNVSVYNKLAKMTIWTSNNIKYGMVYFENDEEALKFCNHIKG